MSKIDEMIAKLCPNGVEYIDFLSVCNYIRGITYNKNDEINNGTEGIGVLRANNITLDSNTLNFDDVKIVSYGTPKSTVVNEIGILFDDEEKNRIEWNNAGGYAYNVNNILEILRGL